MGSPCRSIESKIYASDSASKRLAVFGSFLREDFRADSDIDFLARFQNNDYGPWMGKLQEFERELARLLERGVEVVPRESVERSENWIRRDHILATARVIYGS